MQSTSTQGGVEGRVLLLREEWDAVYQYSGRSGRQSVITQGGVGCSLLVLREGWKAECYYSENIL